MSSFTTPLQVEFVAARRWRLTSPFIYHFGSYPAPDALVFTVPAGFETDLASIPALLRGIFPPDGAYTKAAVLHDYLYKNWRVELYEDAPQWSRHFADAMFYEAMGVLNVPQWQRIALYLAVRCGGWRYFR